MPALLSDSLLALSYARKGCHAEARVAGRSISTQRFRASRGALRALRLALSVAKG